MNANLPSTLAFALLPMAPPQSVVHQIVSEERAKRIDAAMLADKKIDGYAQRNFEAAMFLQLNRTGDQS